MTRLKEVAVGVEPLSRFASYTDDHQMEEAIRLSAAVRESYAGRAMFHVNSTAVGGGVAEMLRPLLAYARGAGIDARWIVIEGDPGFFKVTKRLHHALHGAQGDASPLGEDERSLYEHVLRQNATELLALVRPNDLVVLHDPQTAGLAPSLAQAGARVVWRCHIGTSKRNEEVARAVAFLGPYLDAAAVHIFSRPAYVGMGFDARKAAVVRPSIDAFSPKNQAMAPEVVEGILVHTGLVDGPDRAGAHTGFVRMDGSPGRVERKADVVGHGAPFHLDQPLVVQVSRWDPLKDPIGVLRGFAAALGEPLEVLPNLVLAGPDVVAVADDPEAMATLDAVIAELRTYPETVREHVSLVTLPVADVDENAAIVNALQRHATIVVQKSLEEGFGLTVTEAMWKRRAIVASAVGGICDQIEDGVHGLLLRDPRDHAAFADSIVRLLRDRGLRERLGAAAHDRAREEFLGIRHLIDYARLLLEMNATAREEPASSFASEPRAEP